MANKQTHTNILTGIHTAQKVLRPAKSVLAPEHLAAGDLGGVADCSLVQLVQIHFQLLALQQWVPLGQADELNLHDHEDYIVPILATVFLRTDFTIEMITFGVSPWLYHQITNPLKTWMQPVSDSKVEAKHKYRPSFWIQGCMTLKPATRGEQAA